MTRKVFWEDPYLTRLDTHVHSVTGDVITVDETIFYAFSGGQESDMGTMGAARVLQARKEGLEIFYTLDSADHLKPGDALHMTIDWERRYRLMRLHFAAELVLELTTRYLQSIQKIGAHIAMDKSRIDFAWSGNIATLFPAITEQAQGLIDENRPIISAFSDEANERRYWEIEDFARVACGGTHLKRTGEVGTLDLKRRNVGKGKERIEIYLAER